MNIDKLKQRREKLKTALAAIDARIAQAERKAREAEQRELLKLIKSRGLSAAQIKQLLQQQTRAQTEQKAEAAE